MTDEPVLQRNEVGWNESMFPEPYQMSMGGPKPGLTPRVYNHIGMPV